MAPKPKRGKLASEREYAKVKSKRKKMKPLNEKRK